MARTLACGCRFLRGSVFFCDAHHEGNLIRALLDGIEEVPYRTPACDKHLSRNEEHECPWCKLDEERQYSERMLAAYQEAHRQAMENGAAYHALASRLGAVIPALQTIAMQKLRSEFHPDEQDGDYEFAYEVIVKMVRGAVERAGIMVALPSAPVVERQMQNCDHCGDLRYLDMEGETPCPSCNPDV